MGYEAGHASARARRSFRYMALRCRRFCVLLGRWQATVVALCRPSSARTNFVIAQVDNGAGRLPQRVEGEDGLVTQEERRHVELLEEELREALPVRLRRSGCLAVAQAHTGIAPAKRKNTCQSSVASRAISQHLVNVFSGKSPGGCLGGEERLCNKQAALVSLLPAQLRSPTQHFSAPLPWNLLQQAAAQSLAWRYRMSYAKDSKPSQCATVPRSTTLWTSPSQSPPPLLVMPVVPLAASSRTLAGVTCTPASARSWTCLQCLMHTQVNDCPRHPTTRGSSSLGKFAARPALNVCAP